MIVINFEDWAAAQGASRQSFGDAGMHSPAGHIGRANWRDKMQSLGERNQALANRRTALRTEYDRLCDAGELRPPTHKERITATARGNPDREDVRAAMRICIKRGWPWHLS